ncbi:MAG: hypothetical protein Q7S27_01045 [Nanoarchaeota archaeon]|nr:hypothetical protein [Nanoarchaeota archaeon]
MEKSLEKEIISLIAMDRLHIPISSMSGKLKRRQPKQAQSLEIEDTYEGERVYARVDEKENLKKARGMKEGIKMFEENFPKYGQILRGLIEAHREYKEKHLYFGIQEGRRLTADDYMGVMTDLGLSEKLSRDLYPELMNLSRNLSKERKEERRILIGSSYYEELDEDESLE